ncbi:MAG TPA: AbrB/MazE/SpoVT family DNA-binding domain-containing protein [Verrucomicrobiota bacterium]|nr:AbrB/MazE/SpoVT family DNA-binding domain-containing protein [Verrucomicrobiota bacterium]HNU51789.1 AbrB/MazE/SpoVT family DNA-binding domain-containing protein [Verrucomicrobiota bacterium]
MKELDVMTISRVGQSTFPKAWREAAGLSRGGVVEVRPLQDGKHSLLLTPRPARREGAVGLLKAMRGCPRGFPDVPRHALPFK